MGDRVFLKMSYHPCVSACGRFLVPRFPRSCIIDSAISNMAESLCLCRVRWSQRWFEDHGEGFSKWSSSPLKHFAACGAAEGACWALCRTECTTLFPRCPLWRQDVDRCISGDDDPAALPPSGVVALSEPDPEMSAMLSRATENVGLVWNPPPCPDPLWLDECFLGGGLSAGGTGELRALGPHNSSLSVTEDSRRGRLSPSRGWPTG